MQSPGHAYVALHWPAAMSLHPDVQCASIPASPHPYISPPPCILVSHTLCTPAALHSLQPSYPAPLHPHTRASRHPSHPSSSPSVHLSIPPFPHPSTLCIPIPAHSDDPAFLHPSAPGIPISQHPDTLHSHIPASWHPPCQAVSAEHPLHGKKLRSSVSLMKMELEQRRETHSLRSQVKCFNVKCAILLSLDRSHLMKAH